MVIFRNVRPKTNFAQVGVEYAYGHMYIPIWIQTPYAERPLHRLCYRPTAFFRHLRLIELSFPQREFRGSLTKSYKPKSWKCLTLDSFNRRMWCSLTKHLYVFSRVRHIASQQTVMSTGSYPRNPQTRRGFISSNFTHTRGLFWK